MNLITVESPNGPDPTLPIDALLAELVTSAEKPSIKSVIRSALNKRLTQVDAASLQAGLQADENMNQPSGGPSSSSASTVPRQGSASSTSSSSTSTIVRQSSLAAQASQQQPRPAQPLKMTQTEASKQRMSYAQATMAVATTLIEQPQRLPTQRVVKATPFLGAFVGQDALVARGTKRKVEPRAGMVAKRTVVTSSAPPGMVQSVPATAVPAVTASVGQLGTTTTQSRVIPPSLFLGSDDNNDDDDDDDDSYYQTDIDC